MLRVVHNNVKIIAYNAWTRCTAYINVESTSYNDKSTTYKMLKAPNEMKFRYDFP
jgi:hypothetical protein